MISILITIILCLPPILLLPSSFGLRLDHEHIAQIVDIKLRYRAAGVIIAVIAAVCVTLIPFPGKLATPIIFIALHSVNWFVARRSVRRRKFANGWLDDEETKVREAGHSFMLPVLTLPLYLYTGGWLALLLAAIYLDTSWDSMPVQIPIHFDPGFKTDTWAPRNGGSVYFLTFLGLALSLVFLLICLFIRLPSFTRGKAFRTSHVATLATAIHALSWLQCLITLSFAYNQVAYLLPTLHDYEKPVSISSLVACVIMFVGGLCYVILQTGRYEHAARELFPDQLDDDDKKFYILGMFYYNPTDMRVLVNDRFGVGLDFNWARWQSQAFMLVVLGVIVAVIIPAA